MARGQAAHPRGVDEDEAVLEQRARQGRTGAHDRHPVGSLRVAHQGAGQGVEGYRLLFDRRVEG